MNKTRREDAILKQIHEIREQLFLENRSKSFDAQADDDNKQADEILKKWGIKLEKADYLLRAVK